MRRSNGRGARSGTFSRAQREFGIVDRERRGGARRILISFFVARDAADPHLNPLPFWERGRRKGNDRMGELLEVQNPHLASPVK